MPVELPYKFNDRRRWAPGAAQIAEAARPSPRRNNHFGFDRDHQRTIQGPDRRAIMSIARWLYANDPIVRGAVNDMATIAAGNLSTQFTGKDAAWGAIAEKWLGDHDRFCCIRGASYSMQVLKRLAVLHDIIDGDCFFLLTEGDGGWPLLQFIPGHRVRGDFAKAGINPNGAGGATVVNTPWADYPVTDGVIMDDYGRPLAYRVWEDLTYEFRDIDATNMVHSFRAEAGDQVRGVSALVASMGDFSDLGETRKWELLAQKLGASIALIETNETGAPPDDAAKIIGSDDATDDSQPSIYGREMRGGEIQYFRSGTGSKLESLQLDRPTSNQREFAREMGRNALHGMGWSIDYSLDPSRLGGAPMRVVVEKLNRTMADFREHVLFPLSRRIDGWRVAKAEKAGLIPTSKDDDWRSWMYKGAPDLTADAMYAAQVMELELAKGITSEVIECNKRGHDVEAVIDQKIKTAVMIRDKCAAAGIDPSEIRILAKQSTQTFNDPAQNEEMAGDQQDSNGQD